MKTLLLRVVLGPWLMSLLWNDVPSCVLARLTHCALMVTHTHSNRVGIEVGGFWPAAFCYLAVALCSVVEAHPARYYYWDVALCCLASPAGAVFDNE